MRRKSISRSGSRWKSHTQIFIYPDGDWEGIEARITQEREIKDTTCSDLALLSIDAVL